MILSALRAELAKVRERHGRITEAVIVLGAPRSGTSVLFETLARHSMLWSLGTESHAVLEGPFHPSHFGWESNALSPLDLDPATARRLRSDFWRRAKPANGDSASRLETELRRALGIRLLEKTPKNCFRIEFLAAMFPRVRFLFLRRDGRETVSSLMDGWRAAGRFETYELPVPLHISGYSGQKWCFVLPPGWRSLVSSSLEEVCAHQWASSIDAVLKVLPSLRARGLVYELAYEDLIARPREVLANTLSFLGLPWEEGLLSGGDTLRVTNTVTPPAPGKWRTRNGPAIERILPRIADAQRALGYTIDA